MFRETTSVALLAHTVYTNRDSCSLLATMRGLCIQLITLLKTCIEQVTIAELSLLVFSLRRLKFYLSTYKLYHVLSN